MNNLYLDAYNEAVDWHLKRDLQAWGELLSRHAWTLRKPYASGRPAIEVEDDPANDTVGVGPGSQIDVVGPTRRS